MLYRTVKQSAKPTSLILLATIVVGLAGANQANAGSCSKTTRERRGVKVHFKVENKSETALFWKFVKNGNDRNDDALSAGDKDGFKIEYDNDRKKGYMSNSVSIWSSDRVNKFAECSYQVKNVNKDSRQKSIWRLVGGGPVCTISNKSVCPGCEIDCSKSFYNDNDEKGWMTKFTIIQTAPTPMPK